MVKEVISRRTIYAERVCELYDNQIEFVVNTLWYEKMYDPIIGGEFELETIVNSINVYTDGNLPFFNEYECLLLPQQQLCEYFETLIEFFINPLPEKWEKQLEKCGRLENLISSKETMKKFIEKNEKNTDAIYAEGLQRIHFNLLNKSVFLHKKYWKLKKYEKLDNFLFFWPKLNSIKTKILNLKNIRKKTIAKISVLLGLIMIIAGWIADIGGTISFLLSFMN